jgi:hypothetical protein
MGAAGDANIGFFHNIANSRKIKCTIFSMEEDGQEIDEPKKLRVHIDNFYKNLFRRGDRGTLRLDENFLMSGGCLTEEDAKGLTKPFTEKEIKLALEEMRKNSAPGPDGLPVEFYKCFWD